MLWGWTGGEDGSQLILHSLKPRQAENWGSGAAWMLRAWTGLLRGAQLPPCISRLPGGTADLAFDLAHLQQSPELPWRGVGLAELLLRALREFLPFPTRAEHSEARLDSAPFGTCKDTFCCCSSLFISLFQHVSLGAFPTLQLQSICVPTDPCVFPRDKPRAGNLGMICQGCR